MTTVVKNLRCKKGQASIEAALALPFLVFLLYWTINAFHAMHTGHIGQKYAAMNLYQRLDNRAQFAVDDVAAAGRGQVFDKYFMAVQYTDEQGAAPKRRILLVSPNPPAINNVIGICREPSCD